MTPVYVGTSGAVVYTNMARRFADKSGALDNVASHGRADAAGQSEIETSLLETAFSAVLISHFAVEATMNELFLAAEESSAWRFGGLSEDFAKRLGNAWQNGVSNLGPGEKADQAMQIIRGRSVNWGQAAAQKFECLNSLRNELVHHKPKLVAAERRTSSSEDKLERRLHTQFSTAAIWKGRGAAFRWFDCLGGDCARWSYNTANAFMQEFFAELGCDYPRPQG